MRLPRSSGILLPVSALPGPFGIGDFGPAAYRFVDFLQRAGQSIWQVLPLGPLGYGASPYQSVSVFAGNSLLISLEKLREAGWLDTAALESMPEFSADRVDYARATAWRKTCLAEAAQRFAQRAAASERAELETFRNENAWWLDDYTTFVAVKDFYHGAQWTRWDPAIASRDPTALSAARKSLASAIEAEAFVQFQFARQWQELKQYANEHQVRIMGDLPIFVSHDSADVWTHQELFQLDRTGEMTAVAGVPPDYFSETGQLWGNPLYRWDTLAERQYDWWIERFRYAFERLDLVRLDHFRGFEAYWKIAAGARDATQGHWAPGPGAALFHAAEERLGPLPLVAEDLGVITPEVDALREELGLPGMRVLQFAFGSDPKANEYQPHNYVPHCVVYTGTHDNDTTAGWFHSVAGEGTTRTAEEIEQERATTLAYLGTDGREIHWDMIRLAWGSVADTAIVPLQDVLGLGSAARMNLPGTTEGNWQWRLAAEQLTPEIESRLRTLTEIYERMPSGTGRPAPRKELADAPS